MSLWVVYFVIECLSWCRSVIWKWPGSGLGTKSDIVPAHPAAGEQLQCPFLIWPQETSHSLGLGRSVVHCTSGH